MSQIHENGPTSDDHRFDLLADGELSEPNRRELLSGLDDEPGGWRRCALAFLESQSWKQELGQIVGEPSPRPSAGRLARLSRWSGPGGTLLAMAASFLVALGLGWWLQGTWEGESPAVRPGLDALADNEEPPGTVPAENAPEGLAGTLPGQHGKAPADKVYLVELPGVEGEGQGAPILAVERPQIDARSLLNLPGAMSPELLDALRRAGMRIEQRRELIPLRMRDGRSLVVPVENVDVHYVGNPTL